MDPSQHTGSTTAHYNSEVWSKTSNQVDSQKPKVSDFYQTHPLIGDVN